MTWSLYSRMLRFCHAFHGRDVRRRLGVLLFVLVVEGCAATATSDGAAPKPPLPLGELLLVGFGGTQVEGNEEVRELVCDVKVGGLILFERDARTGEARDVAATELESRRMGATLREAGINWNLAPVVDVAVNPLNPAVVTLGRTFSSDPQQVIAQARAVIPG